MAVVQANLDGHGINVNSHEEISIYQSTKQLQVSGVGFRDGLKVGICSRWSDALEWMYAPLKTRSVLFVGTPCHFIYPCSMLRCNIVTYYYHIPSENHVRLLIEVLETTIP